MRIATTTARLICGLAIAAALTTATAASAHAAPAFWNPAPAGGGTGYAAFAGTLTMTTTSYPATTCTVNLGSQYANTDTGVLTTAHIQSPCAAGGKLPLLWYQGSASSNAGAYSLTVTQTSPFSYLVNPWSNYGTYVQIPFTAPYTNGNATTPSKITFNNTTIGTLSGTPVKATGTLTYRQSSGGLITLN